MSSSSDDEDDPVIQEVDMYLAKGLAEKLLLFQYPVRPSNSTYDFTPHLAARIKPVQQKVELELGIDTNSSTYCYARGEQIAYAVDADTQPGGNQKVNFPDNVMDRQLLSSVRATEDSSKYAAAIYCDGAIHITPIKGIFQMHPCFNYFDKAEENQKKAASTKDDEAQKEEELDAKPVQLRFAKGQNQKKKEHGMKQEAEEKWVDTQFYQPQDRRAIMERNLLLCHQEDFESPEFTVTSRDYLKILSPSEQHGAESPADLPHGVLSLLKLKGMSLTDQIKALLITAKVLQFTQLCALLGLGGGMDTNAVLTGLTQYAMLVQGCWVVKSNILYPQGSKSHVSGLDAEKLWPSRDYVMFCFNRRRVLSRKEVASNTRLPTEELREVLEQIGKQRPAQGWEFMLNTDNEFLREHPEDCLNQLSIWKQKYKELSELFNLSEEFSDSDWNETNFPGLFPGANRKPTSSRRRRTSQSAGIDSTTEKGKPKARRRTKSQSSQDGSPVAIKVEQLSPRRNTNKSESDSIDSKLNINVLDIQGLPNETISPKLPQKHSKPSPKKIAKKSPKVESHNIQKSPKVKSQNLQLKNEPKNNPDKIIGGDSLDCNPDHVKNLNAEVNNKEIPAKQTNNKEITAKQTIDSQKYINPFGTDNNPPQKQINNTSIQQKNDYSQAQHIDHTAAQKHIHENSMDIDKNLEKQKYINPFDNNTVAKEQINENSMNIDKKLENKKYINPFDIDNNLPQKQINDSSIQRKIDYSQGQQQLDHIHAQMQIDDTSAQKQTNYTSIKTKSGFNAAQQIDCTASQKQINDTTVQKKNHNTSVQNQINYSLLQQIDQTPAQQMNDTPVQKQFNDSSVQRQIDYTRLQQLIYQTNDILGPTQFDDLTQNRNLEQKEKVAAEYLDLVEKYNETNTEDTSEFTGKRKRNKKRVSVISDSDDECEAELTVNAEGGVDVFMGDAGKSVNIIEVGVNRDERINTNDNTEEIFVPPMLAAGGRIERGDKERPPSDIFIKELKRFCREAIQSGCLSLMELKEVLQLRQQESGNILCTGVSDELLINSAKASGVFEIPLKWSEPNNIPIERKRVFLYRCLGDNTDMYRNVIIDLFSKSQSLRRKDIFEAFKNAVGEVPSAHMYTKVISEFCQNHNGQWYLNGTYTSIQKYSNS